MKHDIYEQFRFEDEGAAAALNGKTRYECPYDRNTDSFKWNHWVFGHDMATSEQAIITSGFVTLTSTGEDSWKYPTKIPINKAIDSGIWKPRYVNLTERSS